MSVDIVVDVGNSRIKWGLCHDGAVKKAVSLPDNPEVWQRQLKEWRRDERLKWAIAGVHPVRCQEMAGWVEKRGDKLLVLENAKKLPLRIDVQNPNGVGIDRLLNAVAAKDRVQRAVSRVIIDAGTAVTVDWVDEDGAFRGGAILPGVHLMFRALHDYTARLPLLEGTLVPVLPGTTTESAMRAGVFWAVAGGIKSLVRLLAAERGSPADRAVFLTGGDVSLLAPVMDLDIIIWPTMTLEGIRLSAEALP